ncbi:MAG: hypothetical protein NTW19_23050 [Planctomycetota bacterium]|nr:hypothetical protein [Planctomycetota bacterium]
MHKPHENRPRTPRSIFTLASIGAAAAALAAAGFVATAAPAAPPDGPSGGPPRGGSMNDRQGPGNPGPDGPPGGPGGYGPGGREHGPQQGPPNGPPGGQSRGPARPAVALSGKVERYNLSPRGTYDAILLRAGDKLVQINLQPDMGGMVALAAPVGAQIQVSARPELGMPDHSVYTLAGLTTADNKKIDLDARPKDVTVEGVVKQLNYSPVGDVNGVLLDNGDFVHLGPEGATLAEVKVGQKISVEGRSHGMALGGNSIEAQSVNGKDIPRPPRPTPGMGPGGPGGQGGLGMMGGMRMGGPGMGGQDGPGPGGDRRNDRGGRGGMFGPGDGHRQGPGQDGGDRRGPGNPGNPGGPGGPRMGGDDDRQGPPPQREGQNRGGPRGGGQD